MLRPRAWLRRQRRRLRPGMVLCLTVAYGTVLLAFVPLLTNLDKISTADYNPSAEELHYSGHRPVDDDHGGKGSESFFLQKLFYLMFNSARKQIRGKEINGDSGSVREGGFPWDVGSTPALFGAWEKGVTSACGGRLLLYVREFARLSSVVVDRRYCVAEARGGEEIAEVLRQDEGAEYYGRMRHCFQLDCGEEEEEEANRSMVVAYRFNKKNNYLNAWLQLMKTADVRIDAPATALEPGFTVALVRREYANLYHTVNEWYNLFLTMAFFRRRPAETNVLLVDAHPKGSLDEAWSVLFNSTRMLSALPQRTVFADMVWAAQGYNSVLRGPYRAPRGPRAPQHLREPPPMLEEFRRFVLDRFRLRETKTLNCSGVSVLFIWRRDYLAHPRNPTGLVKRKIANEAEILTELRRRHPQYTITGVQIDRFSMRDQLRMVSGTDVLVGMHGAGLSHTLFVPPHAGTIELVPIYYGASNEHFVNIARWRGLVAERWINTDAKNELKGFSTVVPIPVIDALLTKTVARVCSESPETRLERMRRERSGGARTKKAGPRSTRGRS